MKEPINLIINLNQPKNQKKISSDNKRDMLVPMF